MLDGRVYGFRKGFENASEDMFKEDKESRLISYNLIELALILTHD